jgi:ABC-type bacteriocin/lantibiotic exporter with double-glycine peptidase domain
MMPGEKICVMGDASSGKSTLLEVVTGALQHQQGAVLVNGIPIGNYQPDSYRKHIGVFYHDQDIFQGSLLDNITMGDPAVDIQSLMPLVEAVGLQPFISSLPAGFDTLLQPTGKGLSSIIAKKILLLRAFAGNPELLLLDEPFEMAGGEHWLKIEQYLLGLKNISMIVVTGDVEFAKQCDQLIILENGKVKKSGNPRIILQEEGKI